ncbi:MAG: triphosphoribosyl-dephospho-CoA synthase, partial [Candidatus Cryptobacteroides sp.]|nr:triphosphoribosyl-dephospho-CoA synthase [Candidatus Cryptobacteroides sp.]
ACNPIQEMPLRSPFFRSKVEGFLQANGLRMETLDVYYTLQNTDGAILAGAGLAGDVIKCVAVAPEARSEGLVAPLVSHILSQHGPGNLKVFTKPENEAVFGSLGFHAIARAPLAILMENGRGLEAYCACLKDTLLSSRPTEGSGEISSSVGVVVMNANPFTLGHRYLLEQAAARVDRLVVIPVRTSYAFPYTERLAMIKAGAPSGVTVVEGSDYQISAATFPTYFLKDLSEAAETQMRLDLDLFARHIAPALGATVRFVGSEPQDPLTARYNTLMQELLPLKVVEIPRLKAEPVSEENYFLQGFAKNQFSSDPVKPINASHTAVISASAVRTALEQGSYSRAAALCPESTRPYLMAALAERALRRELDAPLKPGLVGPDSSGAHTDMDYALMQKAIAALRPYWSRMAKASVPPLLQMIGIEAEKAMKKATGGVNTHRGAIFALGLALNARGMDVTVTEEVMQNRLCKIAGVILRNGLIDSALHLTAKDATASHLSHGEEAVKQYGVQGARSLALEGYKDLWAHWLPYYRSLRGQASSCPEQQTLLRIMSTLDDTCVIHRVGYERAQEVKREAADVLIAEEKWFFAKPCEKYFSSAGNMLQDLCVRYAAEGISPGGAADMLALTILIDSLTN